ncbi:hypothetical protein L218DRAFT_1008443 [Marasmius fiardii PR-910]|nr:hypothetical protein L218DRAFT_1008443 [Marasmius fiardii PR-910]
MSSFDFTYDNTFGVLFITAIVATLSDDDPDLHICLQLEKRSIHLKGPGVPYCLVYPNPHMRFLASRVYKCLRTSLNAWKSLIFLVLLLCCIAGNFVTSLSGIIEVFTLTYVSDIFTVRTYLLTSLCFNIAVDVSLTAVLTWTLANSKIGQPKHDQALRILTISYFNTGIMPS